MGFFPDTIRRLYPEMNITFIDVAGLADLHVTQRQEPKNPVGVTTDADIERIVAGQANNFSQYALYQAFTLMDTLRVNPDVSPQIKALDLQMVRNEPRAIIVWNPTP